MDSVISLCVYNCMLCVQDICNRIGTGVGVEGPSRGDPVKGWKMMGCSVRSDNLF